MKHLKLFEYYVSDKRKRRRYEEWSKLSDKEKYDTFDAESIFRKVTKEWDKGQPWYAKEPYWSIRDYLKDYTDAPTKAVYLSADSDLLNRWKVSEETKGLKEDFYKWLKKNNYDINWDTNYDGIFITPKDFEGLYWYYDELAGVKPKLSRERKVRSEKSDKEIKEIIELFKKNGYDVTEPVGSETNDFERDRYEFEYQYEGMLVRIYIMRIGSMSHNKSYSSAVKEEVENIKEHFRDYLPEIKYVYDYCESIAEGSLWTMPGGGGQLQQFYGDDNGYLCILYMGMRGEKDNRVCDLEPQRRRNDFKNFDKKPLKKFAKFRKEVNKYNL